MTGPIQEYDSKTPRNRWESLTFWVIIGLMFTGLFVMAVGENTESGDMRAAGFSIMVAAAILGIGIRIHLAFARRAGRIAERQPRQLGAILVFLGTLMANFWYEAAIEGDAQLRTIVAAILGSCIGIWLLITGRTYSSHGEKLETWWYAGLAGFVAVAIIAAIFLNDVVPDWGSP